MQKARNNGSQLRTVFEMFVIFLTTILVLYAYGIYRNRQVTDRNGEEDYNISIRFSNEQGEVVTKEEVVACINQLDTNVTPEQFGNRFELGIISVLMDDNYYNLYFGIDSTSKEICAPNEFLNNMEQNGWMIDGRCWTEHEYNEEEKVAVVALTNDNGESYGVGDFITISDEKYKVVGNWSYDTTAFIPLTAVDDTVTAIELSIWFREKITLSTFSQIEKEFSDYFGDRVTIEKPSDLYDGETYFIGNQVLIPIILAVFFVLMSIMIVEAGYQVAEKSCKNIVKIISIGVVTVICGIVVFLGWIYPVFETYYPYIHSVYSINLIAFIVAIFILGIIGMVIIYTKFARPSKRLSMGMILVSMLGIVLSLIPMYKHVKPFIQYYMPIEHILNEDGYYIYTNAVNVTIDGEKRMCQDSDELCGMLKKATVDSCYLMLWDVAEAGQGKAAFTVYDESLANTYVPALKQGKWLADCKPDNNVVYAVVAPNDKGFEVGSKLTMRTANISEEKTIELEVVGVLSEDAKVIGSVYNTPFQIGDDYQAVYSSLEGGINDTIQFFVLKNNVTRVLDNMTLDDVPQELRHLLYPIMNNVMFVTFDKNISSGEREYNNMAMEEMISFDGIRELQFLQSMSSQQIAVQLAPEIACIFILILLSMLHVNLYRLLCKGDRL